MHPSMHACRRQEIVFIGASMDRPAIEAQLDSALLTDAGARVRLCVCVGGCVRVCMRGVGVPGVFLVCTLGSKLRRLPPPAPPPPPTHTHAQSYRPEMQQYTDNYSSPDPPHPEAEELRSAKRPRAEAGAQA